MEERTQKCDWKTESGGGVRSNQFIGCNKTW